jgi:hypothetical protein
MEKSKDLKPAQLAIDKIATIDNEADLSAFIEGEERVTVTAAADARYAELVSATDEEEATDEVATPAEQPSEEAAESVDTTETEEVTEEVEVIIISGDEFEAIGVVIVAKVEQETVRFTNGKLPAGDVTEALKISFEAVEQASSGEEQVEIPAPVFDAFVDALKNQVTIDQSNRGLSQPGKVDADLVACFKALTEEQ